MALATRCPHCETAFRVASDQLKLRAGLVRCGTCHQIFNGIEHLLPPDEDIPAALAASAPPPLEAPLLGPAAQRPPAIEKEPAMLGNALIGRATAPGQSGSTPDPAEHAISRVDPENAFLNAGGTWPVPAVWLAPESRIDSAAPAVSDTHAGAGIDATAKTDSGSDTAPQSDPPRMALADAPPRPEAGTALPGIDTNTAMPAFLETVSGKGLDQVAASVPDHALDPAVDDTVQTPPIDVLRRPDTIPSMAGLLRTAGVDDGGDLSSPPRMPALRPKTKPVMDVKPAPELADLPDFVVRDQKKKGMHRAWQPVLWTACTLLGVVLILQTIYATRTMLAASFPQTRGILDAACHLLRCSVGLPTQIEFVSIESSDFQPVDGNRDLFLLTVLLRNRGTTVQGWPYIELTLNDAADRAVGRRVITPSEYLATAQDTFKGLTAGAEQPVRLYFELTRIKALGYRVYLFYP